MSSFINLCKFTIKRSAFSPPLNRNLSTSLVRYRWRRINAADVEKNLLRKDQLPETYQLIYRAPLEHYVTWTKNISTFTVSVLGGLAAYQWATTVSYITMVEPFNLGSLVTHEEDLMYFLGGFILINIAIRAFVAKYPLRIYRQASSYVAVYESQLPVGVVKHYFEKGQVAEYRNILNPWQHIMYRLGNRSSMLLLDYFKTPSEFHKLFRSN